MLTPARISKVRPAKVLVNVEHRHLLMITMITLIIMVAIHMHLQARRQDLMTRICLLLEQSQIDHFLITLPPISEEVMQRSYGRVRQKFLHFL